MFLLKVLFVIVAVIVGSYLLVNSVLEDYDADYLECCSLCLCDDVELSEESGEWYIQCGCCFVAISRQTKEEVIKAWNHQ